LSKDRILALGGQTKNEACDLSRAIQNDQPAAERRQMSRSIFAAVGVGPFCDIA
jgi:hypothetical protein